MSKDGHTGKDKVPKQKDQVAVSDVSSSRKVVSHLRVLDCVRSFTQKGSLLFSNAPAQYVVARGISSMHAMTEGLTLEVWLRPSSFQPHAAAVCRTDTNLKCGFGIMSFDWGAAAVADKNPKKEAKGGAAPSRGKKQPAEEQSKCDLPVEPTEAEVIRLGNY